MVLNSPHCTRQPPTPSKNDLPLNVNSAEVEKLANGSVVGGEWESKKMDCKGAGAGGREEGEVRGLKSTVSSNHFNL